MKVEVLQVEDVEIGKFSWWSKWIDIAVFDQQYKGHLMQMRISRNNSKRFRCIPFKGKSPLPYATSQEAGDLMPINTKEIY